MSGVLLLRLAAPLQSWGTQSRFLIRDTGREPSRSGVIGILCAALGMPRTAPLNHFNSLKFAVRVDREGVVIRDFHTVGGGEDDHRILRHTNGIRKYGVSIASTGRADRGILTERYYLSDARFLVGLGSEDLPFLEKLEAALREPKWPLYLGRKACIPSEPILPPGRALREGTSDPVAVLTNEPWSPRVTFEKPPESLRIVFDSTSSKDSGQPRADLPISFNRANRSYADRLVDYKFITPKEVVS
ncbi:MAG: type I-E CRISPR-associated protein Cas5/CasD [Candidatus Sumerlaeia bacterium]|nr:type I-E CRISPR-associated protein Cas5/CasD [Candidatus Sumerlaeia bacterium]